MSDLFKKINTLIKASVNDVLGDDWAVDGPRRRHLMPDKLGKDVDREIAALRQKVNEALDHETKLQSQITSLQDEIVRWDQQADEAVAQSKDATARYAIEQMQRAEQRRTMMESDLHEHRLVTQELIQRVNMLEAAVADARRAKEAEAAPATPETQTLPGSRLVSDVLRETREKISQMSDLITAKEEVTASSPASVQSASNEKAVDDDLEQRRQRLSK
jgi:phage shock protein A